MDTAAGGGIEAAPTSPEGRALQLLHRYLDEQQRRDLDEAGGFRYKREQRLYWIPLKAMPRCALLDERMAFAYCISPIRANDLPPADRALTYLTWISGDNRSFHRRANVMKSVPLRGATEDEMCRFLSTMTRGSTYGTAPYREYRPEAMPVITDEERQRGLAASREIRLRLRMELLRDSLALTGFSDEALRRLAESWTSTEPEPRPRSTLESDATIEGLVTEALRDETFFRHAPCRGCGSMDVVGIENPNDPDPDPCQWECRSCGIQIP